MITLSLCMIVRDEEDVIARCLESVKGAADEIIIVDTGSADRTVEIAQRYTPHVHNFTWVDDFAAARNASFSYATQEYIMWLDADDVLTEEARENLIKLKRTLSPAVDLVMIPYVTQVDEMGNPKFSYYRERILKRARGYVWQGAVHEVISPSGSIFYADDVYVLHKKEGVRDPGRNLRIFESQLSKGAQMDMRQRFYYARELMYAKRYEEAIEGFLEVIDHPATWIENRISACLDASQCYTLLGQPLKAAQALLMSFAYDAPRAEICCPLGLYFMNRQQYAVAVHWYRTALAAPKNHRSGAFVQEECYDFLPHIQLCVCYDKLGDSASAELENELAAQARPDSPAVAHNRAYFASLRAKEADGAQA